MRMRIDEERPGEPPSRPPDRAQLLGNWINTDGGSSGGTVRLEVAEHGDGLLVRGFGVGEPEPVDWGETTAVALAPSVAGGASWAFNCSFELGFMRTEIAAYGKEGILIAASFSSFSDDSARAPCWTREFFHLEGRS